MTKTLVRLAPDARTSEVPVRATGRVPLGQRGRRPDAAHSRAIARILPALGKERVEVAAFQSSI